MSNEEKKDVQVTEAPAKEKTKYDLKMERRAAEKKKAERDEKIFNVVGVLIVVALVALIASFPIRSYRSVHKTVCTIDGEAVSQVEFDYYYNIAKNNFLNSNSQYLQYYGLSADSDMSTVQYSENMSFKDYFEELAIEQLKETRVLAKEAKNAGFAYDVTSDYNSVMDTIEAGAEASGNRLAVYVADTYGDYATVSRLENYIKQALFSTAYFKQVTEDSAISDEEAKAMYEENTEAFDSVDYRILSAKAELPTAPTDKADEGAKVAEDGSYTPSEAEVAAAMEIAKAEADKLVLKVTADGDLNENMRASAVNYYLREWLFDDSRKAGDTTVIENSTSNLYYAVEFENRYLNEDATKDVRVIVTESDNGAEILDAFNANGGTEEAFINLVHEKSIAAGDDGLIEGQSKGQAGDEIEAWLFDESRKVGDTTSMFLDDTYTYVLYYVGENDPAWMLEAKNTLLTQKMNDYLDALVEKVELSDPDGNLGFIAARAADEAAAAAAESAQ